MTLRNKKIIVVGLGKSGFYSALFLKKKGADVRVTESGGSETALSNARKLKAAGIPTETGGHSAPFMDGAELVVTSPGVPKESLPLREARSKKIPVIGEIELASLYCRGSVIAVTGSNGKTTTCHLLHRMLRNAGKEAFLCGNVGTPFVSLLPKIRRKTIVVLEVSSFQLEDCRSFRPKIAVILNVSPNHLDRHKTFGDYLNAKKSIFRKQTRREVLVLNFDRPEVRRMSREASSRFFFFGNKKIGGPGVYLSGKKFIFDDGRKKKKLFDLEDFPLKGVHNLENMLAATTAAILAGVKAGAIQRTLRSFKTLPHRIEPLGECRGVFFINDSKSTTVDSTAAALKALPGSVVLLAGGRDKGAAFRTIEGILHKKTRCSVFYGEARQKIASSFRSYDRYRLEPEFRKAVRLAFESAQPGDSVLLSPMCTSFDQFASYGERGDAFKKAVKALRAS